VKNEHDNEQFKKLLLKKIRHELKQKEFNECKTINEIDRIEHRDKLVSKLVIINKNLGCKSSLLTFLVKKEMVKQHEKNLTLDN